MANGSIFCRALASVATVLTLWALVKVVVFLLSFELVLAIEIVVVVVGKKREKRETISDAIVAVIVSRVYD